MIVLATDNMDCFEQSFVRVRQRAHRPKPASQAMGTAVETDAV